jgi:L-threonylcarbamoyladenylate synthase
MITVILKQKNKKALSYALTVLKAGGIIIYPTESSYGIGCLFNNKKAVQRIFTLKKRSEQKTLPVIVGNQNSIGKYAKLSKVDKKLIKKFMPGPLSLLVPVKRNAPKMFQKKGIVFRIPKDVFARKLTQKVGQPIISTSANPTGKAAAYSSKEVVKLFSGKVDLIIDAGTLKKRSASTIFDSRKQKLIRVGPVKQTVIAALI